MQLINSSRINLLKRKLSTDSYNRISNTVDVQLINGKIRFMPPQLREIGFHVQNHATQWHGFQHEIQFQEVVVASKQI